MNRKKVTFADQSVSDTCPKFGGEQKVRRLLEFSYPLDDQNMSRVFDAAFRVWARHPNLDIGDHLVNFVESRKMDKDRWAEKLEALSDDKNWMEQAEKGRPPRDARRGGLGSGGGDSGPEVVDFAQQMQRWIKQLAPTSQPPKDEDVDSK